MDKKILFASLSISLFILGAVALINFSEDYYRFNTGNQTFFDREIVWPIVHLKHSIVTILWGNQNTITDVQVSSQVPVVKTETKPSGGTQPYKDGGCVLLRSREPVFVSRTCSIQIIKWDKYLFFPQGDGHEKQDITLIAHNVEDGSNTAVYKISENLNDFYDSKSPYALYGLRVIDRKLYFWFGGYGATSALYSIDLPFKDKKAKLIDNRLSNVSIDSRDGNYWIVRGEGDGGEGWVKRALFNPKNQKIEEEMATKFTIQEGTGFIGANDKVAFFESYKRDLESGDKKYVEIYSLDYRNPDIRKVVLSERDLPKGLKSVIYNRSTDELLFNDGRTVTAYKIKTGKTRVINSEVSKSGEQLELRGDHICVSDAGEIDIKTGVIKENRKGCERGGTTEMNEIIDLFKLPKEYSVSGNKKGYTQ